MNLEMTIKKCNLVWMLYSSLKLNEQLWPPVDSQDSIKGCLPGFLEAGAVGQSGYSFSKTALLPSLVAYLPHPVLLVTPQGFTPGLAPD